MHMTCSHPRPPEEILARLPGVEQVAVVPAPAASLRCTRLVVLELASVPPLPSAVRAALGEPRRTIRIFASLNPLPREASGNIDVCRLVSVLMEALRVPGGVLRAGYLEL